MKKEDKNPIILLLVILIILVVAILILYYNMPTPKNTIKQLDCKNYTLDNCPNNCVVCPPCLACSSISCNTKEFCNSIGLNETWYESMVKS